MRFEIRHVYAVGPRDRAHCKLCRRRVDEWLHLEHQLRPPTGRGLPGGVKALVLCYDCAAMVGREARSMDGGAE
jgi:hypothetical protein